MTRLFTTNRARIIGAMLGLALASTLFLATELAAGEATGCNAWLCR